MPPYTIIERMPDVADYNRLRQAVGWGTYPAEVAARALAQSLCGLCVLLEGKGRFRECYGCASAHRLSGCVPERILGAELRDPVSRPRTLRLTSAAGCFFRY